MKENDDFIDDMFDDAASGNEVDNKSDSTWDRIDGTLSNSSKMKFNKYYLLIFMFAVAPFVYNNFQNENTDEQGAIPMDIDVTAADTMQIEQEKDSMVNVTKPKPIIKEEIHEDAENKPVINNQRNEKTVVRKKIVMKKVVELDSLGNIVSEKFVKDTVDTTE